MLEKGIVLVNGLTGKRDYALVGPGARKRDVLKRINLDKYELVRMRGQHRFQEDEDVFDAVKPDDVVFVIRRTRVGSDSSHGFFTWIFGGTQPKGQLKKIREPGGTYPGSRTRVAGNVARTGAPGSPKVRLVKRLHGASRPYWLVRGWRRKNDCMYLGFFKTPFGRFHGVIKWVSKMNFNFYVHGLPSAILDGPHGSCFREVKPDKYHVHFSQFPADVDSGIMCIELLIAEALDHG